MSSIPNRSQLQRQLDQALRNGDQIFRLFDTPSVTVDHLGDRVVCSLFNLDQNWQELHERLSFIDAKAWIYRYMINRGRDPHSQTQHIVDRNANPIEISESWTSRENGVTYEFRLNQGMSYGLFLDQRDNRGKVAQLCRGGTLLNLFCYTGGFSLHALASGATMATNVDSSKATLQWFTRNADLNKIPSDHYKNVAMDALAFLDWAQKKELQYDVVVCDPPSFSRGKKGLFRLEHDWHDLLNRCLAVTRSTLLFSCNLEKWSPADFQKNLRQGTPNLKLEFPNPTWDLTHSKTRMKSAFIRKT